MNTLSDIAFFVEVVKARSLSGAAQELGITTAAVSRRLAHLETRLGIRLLNRTTRRSTLTHEGEIYLDDGRRILEDLEELEQRVSQGQAVPKGLLRVNATFDFGRLFIAPAISEFMNLHPEVEVRLQLTDRPVNLIDAGYDVSIRFGVVPDARITSKKIAANRRLLCASPAYLERFGKPNTPADLQRHRCIVIRESDSAYGTWHFSNGSAQSTVKIRGTASTNDGEVALGWALGGLGIVLRSQWNVAPHLRAGRLCGLLEDWQSPSADIHAVYPMKSNLSAKVKAFIHHLENHFQPYRSATGESSNW